MIMLKKQFKPLGNYVVLERTHMINPLELRGKDPSIPIPTKSIVVAVGENARKDIKIGVNVYIAPNPYDLFAIFFDDNDKDIHKTRDALLNELTAPRLASLDPIMLPPNYSGRSTSTIKYDTKIEVITHVMIQDRDVIGIVLDIE